MRPAISLAVVALVALACGRLEPGWQTPIQFCAHVEVAEAASQNGKDVVGLFEHAGWEWNYLSEGALPPVEVVSVGDCPLDDTDEVSAISFADLPGKVVGYAPSVQALGVEVRGAPLTIACDIQLADPRLFGQGNEACLQSLIRHELAHCYAGTGRHRDKGLLAPGLQCGAGITPADVQFVMAEAGL
jgi:hypothetical protein